MPPIITAAITSNCPMDSAAVPNTYAALLIGPPMSTLIMPPRTQPSRILEEPPIEFKTQEMPVLMAPISGLIAHIKMPIRRMPPSG